MEHKQSNSQWLYEISFMRPILLTLLVSYHAFAPWCGTWGMLEGCSSFEPYRWIALLSRAFRLECFVFISGYIFTFQLLEKHKFPDFRSLLSSKFVRLIIPCWVFSLLYFVCFKKYTSFVNLFLTIINGGGHLWYLPCLFICFFVQWWLLNKTKMNNTTIIIILSILVFFSFVPIPFSLSRPLYYMLFFYGGGLFYQKKDVIASRSTLTRTLLSWMVFLVLLVTFNLFFDMTKEFVSLNQIERGLLNGLDNILKAILAWVGIYSFYTTATIWCRNHQVSDWALEIGVCGYGVYVFHQFVLVWLYDHTSMPTKVGTYWTPWLGFIIATIVSLVLTFLIRKTKIGRQFL